MKKFILIFLVLSAFKLSAALPPLYQNVKEIEMILKDDNLKNQICSGDQILDIKKTDTGYSIYTTEYKVDIDVNYLKQDYVGPAKFELHFYEKEIY